MAGAVGFEPTNDGTKNRCLTTWPRPNSKGKYIRFTPINGVFKPRPASRVNICHKYTMQAQCASQ